MKKIQNIGRQFGSWTIVGEIPRRGGILPSPRWECRCKCGREKLSTISNLRKQKDPQCTCPHGGSGTRLYKIWDGMRQRCNDPNNKGYKNYGARGIKIHWPGFKEFRAWAQTHGYREDLTIERLNNAEGYTPDNCIWANYTAQARNRSNTNLTLEAARTIRGLYALGATNAGIGKLLGIPRQTITHITAGRTWREDEAEV